MALKRAIAGLRALAALVIAASALAPPAAAKFEFESGTVIAKAHAPREPPPPFAWSPFIGLPGLGEAEAIEEIAGAPEATQAGGHPDLSLNFRLRVEADGPNVKEDARTVVADAPAGAIGNPGAVTPCSAADFHLTLYGACPPASQVGEAISRADFFEFLSPVSSLAPFPGVPVLLGFKSTVVTAVLAPTVRSDGDYGLRLTADNIPIAAAPFGGSTITLWGVPHDPVHDPRRVDSVGELGGHIDGTPKPFLSAPTDCRSGPRALTLKARSWRHPEHWVEGTSPISEQTGCELVPFDATLSARPSTNVADSPSGLRVDLRVSQGEDCEAVVPTQPGYPLFDCGLASSHLKDVTIALPDDLVVNSAGANGLDACSASEAGLATPPGSTPIRFDGEPVSCPDASRIGSAEVETPMLDDPLRGAIFLATPNDNPFGSMISVYLAVDDRERGILATLPGKVDADPRTGRLTASFSQIPQLPVEHLRVDIKQGPHAPLRTPVTCGTYTTSSEFTPYSAPEAPVETAEAWSIASGLGGRCAEGEASLPNAPSFDAGTVSPLAGTFSPFVLRLGRSDGSQRLGAISFTLPPGLSAKLAGVGRCSDASLEAATTRSGQAERRDSSCPLASEVGDAVVATGSGPSPYYVAGKAYLAGPYKGAPLSLAIVVPATAGPFDLGTVVVRAALHLGPHSARVTVISDPLPRMLKGIPLDVRTLRLALDRDQFIHTGTSCDPSSVTGELTSTLGQGVPLWSRFQLGDCGQLPFRPGVTLRFSGNLARNGHPSLRAVIRLGRDEAGLASATFTLPAGELLDLRRLDALCARELPPDLCPGASRLGYARLSSPLLDGTLRGPIYARAPTGRLPNLLVDLRLDRLHILLRGQTAASNGRLRVRFPDLPDALISKAAFDFAGGPSGILVNSESLCGRHHRAWVGLRAHNGKLRRLAPRLRLEGRC